MSVSKKNYQLCIIDASYLLYRCYYGLSPLATSTGISTHAVYGFIRTLKKTLDRYDFQKIIVVWDGKKKSFRTELYPEYKAQRQAMPHDLITQKEEIIALLTSLRFCQLSDEGYEADDIIATLAHEYKRESLMIVSADKDLQQLLAWAPHLVLFDPFKEKEHNKQSVEEKNGFPVERLINYFALVGDASDNIPGVRGIGEKTAQKLCMTYATLDALYESLEDLAAGLQKKLREDKDAAYLSRQLFELKPLDRQYDITACVATIIDWQGGLPLFKKLEFTRLIQELERAGLLTSVDLPATEHEEKGSAKKQPWSPVVITTKKSLQELLEKIAHHGLCAVDTETDGSSVLQATLIGVSLAYEKDRAYYIPLRHEEQLSINAFEKQEHHTQRLLFSAPVLEEKASDKKSEKDREGACGWAREALAELKKMLESHAIKKVFHHAHYDELIFRNESIVCHNVFFDTLLAANLLRSADDTKINLKALSMRYLHEPMQSFKEALGARKHFGFVPYEEAALYAAHDALQTLKLYYFFSDWLEKEPQLKKLYETIELPFHEILLDIQERGIRLDPELLTYFTKKIEREREHCLEKLQAALDALKPGLAQDINPNAPRQIEHVLFDLLGLPVIKKSSTGHRSTDQEVLEKLAAHHPVPALIIKYREYAKIKNTYCDALPAFINPKTGRIHSSFSQTLIVTGRISSSEPNLHNIPASGGGVGIREAFVPTPGMVFVSADYSQIELRILAQVTGDEALKQAFIHNHDIHKKTAAELFGCAQSEVTTEQRQLGKRINFSIIYGLTPYGLSQDIGISVQEAKKYIDHYFELYPGIKSWMERTVTQAQACGYVETVYGRRRMLPGLQERNRNIFEAARRAAINTPIQGTQADIIKMSMIKLSHLFKKEKINACIVLHIHDELIIELAHDQIKTGVSLIKQTMEGIVSWEVPLTVSVRTGADWLEITK